MYERGTWRWWTGVVAVPGFFTASIIITPTLFSDRLPDRLATSWDPGGAPTGSMDDVAIVAMLLFFSVMVWAGVAFFGSRRVPGPEILGMAFATGATFAMGQRAVITANLDAPTWELAGSIGNSHLVIYAAAIIAGILGFLLAGGLSGFGRAEGQ